MSEYGDPANTTDFPYLLAASPLDNVSVPNGTGQYPAVMVSTGAHPKACACEPVKWCYCRSAVGACRASTAQQHALCCDACMSLTASELVIRAE